MLSTTLLENSVIPNTFNLRPKVSVIVRQYGLSKALINNILLTPFDWTNRIMISATMPFRGRPHWTHMLCQKMVSCLTGSTSAVHPGTTPEEPLLLVFGVHISAALKQELVMSLANLFNATRCITSQQDTFWQVSASAGTL